MRSGAKILVGGGIPEMGAELDGGCVDRADALDWADQRGPADARGDLRAGRRAGARSTPRKRLFALANDTEYGLASSVWTTDLSRGHRVAQQMRVGMSWVNTWFLRDLRSPFGGVGLSGIGREGGEFSLEFYTEPTNVCVQL